MSGCKYEIKKRKIAICKEGTRRRDQRRRRSGGGVPRLVRDASTLQLPKSVPRAGHERVSKGCRECRIDFLNLSREFNVRHQFLKGAPTWTPDPARASQGRPLHSRLRDERLSRSAPADLTDPFRQPLGFLDPGYCTRHARVHNRSGP